MRCMNHRKSMEQHDPDPNLLKRQQMVDEQIRARGITDERVLRVMEQVSRERFVPPDAQLRAFEDQALPIASSQTISQPFMVAAMTACLDLQPEHRVLEIGTGSGYQTAILASLTAQVFTIERIETLSIAARERLESLGIDNVTCHVGDGSLGLPEQAPFDRILVTAGAPSIPESLIAQLTEGGRLAIPVGSRKQQTLTVVERRQGNTREIPSIACRFVRLIGQQAWSDDATP